MTGFIKPAFDLEMPNIASDDFSDCQLFDFPPECELLLDNLVVPMSSDTLELQHTFRIIAESYNKKKYCYCCNSETACFLCTNMYKLTISLGTLITAVFSGKVVVRGLTTPNPNKLEVWWVGEKGRGLFTKEPIKFK